MELVTEYVNKKMNVPNVKYKLINVSFVKMDSKKILTIKIVFRKWTVVTNFVTNAMPS